MSKKQEAAVSDAVFDYLLKQNRPYSLVDIFNNMHKEHGKTAMQKAIDQLVASDKVSEKVYGKQKVYVVNQGLFPAVNEAEIKAMDQKLTELNASFNESQKESQRLEGELLQLNCSLTTDDAKRLLQETLDELQRLRQKIDSLAENPNQVTAQEKEAAFKDRDKFVKEWRKRKRTTNDMLDSILEGYPKDKKTLYEEVGIETDEGAGVSVPK